MPVSRTRNNSIYGFPNPLANQFPSPLIMRRAPTTADLAEVGQQWVNTVANVAYVLTSITAGQAIWSTAVFGGVTAPQFTITGGDLTVQNPGNIIVQGNGDITTGTGDIISGGNVSGAIGNFQLLGVTTDATIGGNLDVAGDLTIQGDFDIDSPAAIRIRSTFNGANAINLVTDGGTAETMVLQVAQGTGANAMALTSTVGGLHLTSGRANATALVLEATNAVGGIDLLTAGGPVGVATNNGNFEVDTGTGVIAIGTDAVAKNIFLGNSTGVTNVAINAGTSGFQLVTGTGTVAISADAAATTVNIGTGAAVVKTISLGGTGANVIHIGDTQTAGSVSVGAAMTTGTINVGGTGLQTGTVNLAVGTGAQTINLGTGATGAKTINIGTGAAGVKTINVGTGAVANLLTIGSITGAAATVIQAGTGALQLNAAGQVLMQATAAIVASPTATAVINTNVFKAVFQGFTTAAAASQVFIVTNAVITANSGVFVSAVTLGANDAQMTVTRIKTGAGTVSITLKNNGAAAVNGDIIITGWAIDA